MTIESIKGFLLVFGVWLYFLVSGFAYGDYPPPEKIFAHLIGDENDVNSRFRCLFREVLEEVKKHQSDPLKLVGEERGLTALPKHTESSDISMPKSAFSDGHKTVSTDTETSEDMLSDVALLDITLSDSALSEEGEANGKTKKKQKKRMKKEKKGNPLHLADDARCWLRRYFVDGDFLVKIDGLTVQKSEDIDELMQCAKYHDGFVIATKRGCWKREWYAGLSDIFKTLASEAFAEKLLGKATVDAFYTETRRSRTTVYVFLYPSFDSTCPSTVSFCLMYRQVRKEDKGGCFYPMWIGFDFRYNIENNCFTDTSVNLSTFRIGTYRIVTKKQVGS